MRSSIIFGAVCALLFWLFVRIAWFLDPPDEEQEAREVMRATARRPFVVGGRLPNQRERRRDARRRG